MSKIIIIIASLIILLNSFAQVDQDSLELKLNEIYDQKSLPEFALAIVNMEGILYEKALELSRTYNLNH